MKEFKLICNKYCDSQYLDNENTFYEPNYYTKTFNLDSNYNLLSNTNATLQAQYNKQLSTDATLQSNYSALATKYDTLLNKSTNPPVSTNTSIPTVPIMTSFNSPINTSKAPFKNMETFMDFNSAYMNSFNSNINTAFPTYNPNLIQYDNGATNIIGELYKIEKHIKALEDKLQIQYDDPKMSAPITGIQSNYNGAKMAVDEILDSNSNLKYMVKANKGCLTVPGNNKYKITIYNINWNGSGKF